MPGCRHKLRPMRVLRRAWNRKMIRGRRPRPLNARPRVVTPPWGQRMIFRSDKPMSRTIDPAHNCARIARRLPSPRILTTALLRQSRSSALRRIEHRPLPLTRQMLPVQWLRRLQQRPAYLRFLRQGPARMAGRRTLRRLEQSAQPQALQRRVPWLL